MSPDKAKCLLDICKEQITVFPAEEEQGHYKLVSSFAVNFLLDIEPRLSNGISAKDILHLRHV